MQIKIAKRFRQHQWLLAVMLLLFFGACSKSSLTLAPISGTVTYNGKPLTHGKVILVPQKETKGPMGSGDIGPDGKYTIKTAKRVGAIVGNHKVTVMCRRKPTEAEKAALQITPLLIPKQYASTDTTPLELTVPEGGRDFNIELK